MSSRIFNIAIDAAERGAFPRSRKWFWKRLYAMLARFWPDEDWRFMNYGYAPEQPIALDPADEPERGFIGLYHQAVDGLPVKGARVLEVGSGRGGGAAYITRYFAPEKMVAADFSPGTVRRAERLNPVLPGLSYVEGDAEALPFHDDSFDIVVNIESSHCYGDVAAFVAEVARVLRPGGWFTWADIRVPMMMKALEADLDHPALELISDQTLTPGVVRALDMLHERKAARIPRVPVVRSFMMEFAATQGSVLYEAFKNDEAVYLARRYRKRA